MGWEMPLENCNTATVQQIVSFVTVDSCDGEIENYAVIWSRSFGHFRFRERGYLLTIYK